MATDSPDRLCLHRSRTVGALAAIGVVALFGFAPSVATAYPVAAAGNPAAVGRWNGSGTEAVAVRGVDNNVYLRTFDQSSGAFRWNAWVDLGGPIAGDPSIISANPNNLDVFARSPSNQLVHNYWTGSAWSGWQPLPGFTIIGNPKAISPGPGSIDVFAMGSDHQLVHDWFGSGQWQGWSALGWYIISDPAPVSLPGGSEDVFVLGTDRTVWHIWFNGQWQAWGQVGQTQMLDTPSTVVWPSRQHITLLDRNMSGQLVQNWYDPGVGWQPQFSGLGTPPNGPLNGPVAGITEAEPNVDVFALGSNNALWHDWFDGNTWQSWSQLSSYVFPSGATPAAISPSSGTGDVFVRGTDNALDHIAYFGGSWHEWEGLGQPAAQRVDGVSDPNTPYWDSCTNFCTDWNNYSSSPFAQGTFRTQWLPKIKYQRFVAQYDVVSSRGMYQDMYWNRFRNWYANVPADETIAVSIASSTACWQANTIPDCKVKGYPPTTAVYWTNLQQLLDAYPRIKIIEAWNEPNHDAKITPAVAASYYTQAVSLCQTRGCTVLAGGFLDSTNVGSYETDYQTALGAVRPTEWAIHPYGAMKYSTDPGSVCSSQPTTQGCGVWAFNRGLPSGAHIWFTEAGAYHCQNGAPSTDDEQNAAALRLVNTLIPAYKPTHTFYYVLMPPYQQDPAYQCSPSGADTALYKQDGSARPAAATILGG